MLVEEVLLYYCVIVSVKLWAKEDCLKRVLIVDIWAMTMMMMMIIMKVSNSICSYSYPYSFT